eukprot:GILI01019340.1.p2 GENE.GILI01019340.1~~GILI01019340.1.p2  ORF type:complete len:152 (-),score=55.62 GILI01019340.1:53-475(-)
MSSDLLWGLVRKNNAFVVKDRHHGGAIFSREAGNLASKHSPKYSGLVNQATLVVSAADAGVNVAVHVPGRGFKPKALKTFQIKGKSGPRAAAAAAKAAIAHRPSLKKAAAAKVTKLIHSQRPVKGGVQKAKRRVRGAKRA